MADRQYEYTSSRINSITKNRSKIIIHYYSIFTVIISISAVRSFIFHSYSAHYCTHKNRKFRENRKNIVAEFFQEILGSMNCIVSDFTNQNILFTSTARYLCRRSIKLLRVLHFMYHNISIKKQALPSKDSQKMSRKMILLKKSRNSQPTNAPPQHIQIPTHTT